MSPDIVRIREPDQDLVPGNSQMLRLIKILGYNPDTMSGVESDAQRAVEEVLEQYGGIPIDLGIVCDVTGSMRNDWQNLCSILKKLFQAAADFQPVENNPLSRLSLRVRFVLFRDLEHNFTSGRARGPNDWERIQVTDWISDHHQLKQILDWVEVDGGGDGDGETSLEALSTFLAIAGFQAGWTKSLGIMRQVIEFVKATQRVGVDQRPSKSRIEVIKPTIEQVREMVASTRQGVGTSVIFLTDEPSKTSRGGGQRNYSKTDQWYGPWQPQHTVQEVAQAYQQAGIPVFAITTKKSAYENPVKDAFEPIWQGSGWWNLGRPENFDADQFLQGLLGGGVRTSDARAGGGTEGAVCTALTFAAEQTAAGILNGLPQPGDGGDGIIYA